MNKRRRALALVAVALFVGASLCVLDNEAAEIDLCGLVLLPAVGLRAMGPPPLAGRVAPVLIAGYSGDPADPPFPPPKDLAAPQDSRSWPAR